MIYFKNNERARNFYCVIESGDIANVPASIGAVVPDAGNTGDDTTTATGTYVGTTNGVYSVEVTTGGAFDGLVGEVTISYTESGGTPVVVDTVKPTSGVGIVLSDASGVTVTITDGGDTLLTLGDVFTFPVTAAVLDNSIVIPTGDAGKDFWVNSYVITDATGVQKGLFKIQYVKATGNTIITDATGTLAVTDIVGVSGVFSKKVL